MVIIQYLVLLTLIIFDSEFDFLLTKIDRNYFVVSYITYLSKLHYLNCIYFFLKNIFFILIFAESNCTRFNNFKTDNSETLLYNLELRK